MRRLGPLCSAAAIQTYWRWVFTASRKPGGYGSYGRGDTSSLPLACDLLVYSLEEWRSLPQWNPRLAKVLLNDTRWLGEIDGQASESPGRL
jgi:hypothetical protein